MKNRNTWFHFKDEAITGWQYLGRFWVGLFGLILIVPGIWLLAATGYKRASAFGWDKNTKIAMTVIVAFHGIGEMIARIPGYNDTPLNLFDIVGLAAVVVHLVLFFKNGNKILKK